MKTKAFSYLLFATIIFAAGSARAEGGLELGGFLGTHIFSQDNELGVADVATADSPTTSLAIGLRLAYPVFWRFSIEGEGVLLPTHARNADTNVLILGWRLNALFEFLDRKAPIRPFLLVGGGGFSSFSKNDAVIDDETDLVAHGGVGLKVAAGDTWGLRLDGRILFPPSSEDSSVTIDWEIFAGLYKDFGLKKRKRAPKDSDNDGIMDANDRCPSQPEDKDGFQDEDGCPENDNDNDGIPDANDKCPNEAETINSVEDEDGCPEGDEDGDNIFGANDKCPTQKEDKDGYEDEDGCPDTDNDGDGVTDTADRCPDKPETANGYEDSDGCPDEVPAKVAKFTGTIKGIRFKSGSAVIFRSSYPVLDEAVAVLKEFQSVQLEIQGHTDSTGSDATNLTLSDNRAASVRSYLISKGIAEDRLQSRGYGETVPVADNKTKGGRAQNRRVEFKLITQ